MRAPIKARTPQAVSRKALERRAGIRQRKKSFPSRFQRTIHFMGVPPFRLDESGVWACAIEGRAGSLWREGPARRIRCGLRKLMLYYSREILIAAAGTATAESAFQAVAKFLKLIFRKLKDVFHLRLL